MAKTSDKHYWFKAKRYGWGWGLPQTWQGWVSFVLFLAVWLWALSVFLLPVDEDGGLPAKNIITFLVIMVLDVAALVYVSFTHGEPPAWRWGGKVTSAQAKKTAKRGKK